MTVPCGVSIICFSDVEVVMLGKRRGSHGAGEYAPPGGKIEPEEDPRVCTQRELEEETGHIISLSDLNYYPLVL